MTGAAYQHRMSENADIVRRLDQMGERPSSLEAAIREIATGSGTLQNHGSQPTSIQPIRARLPDLNRVTKQALMAMI